MPDPVNFEEPRALPGTGAEPMDAADAYVSQGTSLAQEGHRTEAMLLFRQALRLRPNHPRANHNLGVALAEERNYPDALASFGDALRAEPNYAEAYQSMGNVLGELGRDEEAVIVYRKAIRNKPDFVDALHNLGVALTRLGRPEEAIILLQQALRLRPEFPEGHNNLGLAHAELGEFATAETCYQHALEQQPRYCDSHVNRGSAFKERGRLKEAIACYDLALALEPGSASTRWNRALAWLQMGDFEHGWPEFEWRWRRKGIVSPPFLQQQWDGSPLGGRVILLSVEQGFGDMLQFIRYAPLVKARGGTVFVIAPPPLVALFSSCPGVDRVVADNVDLPAFDLHAPLMSLPSLFDTTLATIPRDVPYLTVSAGQVERWRTRLSVVPGTKVGIAWQGNPRHRYDRHRSIPLALFEALARVDGVSLVSLQKGDGKEQLAGSLFKVWDIESELMNFTDTAAVMKCLDLVISCDTSIVHLAGALGMPTWVALSTVVDWRWLLDRQDSPWYPTMRLFRQEKQGEWKPVFERMGTELAQLVEKPLERHFMPHQSAIDSECLISVIILCFNSASLLARAVQSVLAQETPGTEVIVVAAGPLDTTFATAESLISRFPQVRLLRQQGNTQPAAALNYGLRNARGRFVCFLDSADRYAPNYFASVLAILQHNEELAWISSGLELLNCHREIHPLQLETITRSIATNVIVRKAAIDLIGGFCESQSFQGNPGIEAVAFRTLLHRTFKGGHCPEKFLRAWFVRGGYFDSVLDRSPVVNDELVHTSLVSESERAEIAAAQDRHMDRLHKHVAFLFSIKDVERTCPTLGNRFCQAVNDYDLLRAGFEDIAGFLHSQEGFALYFWARHGPGRGVIVEVGSLFGRSTCWLAAGTRAGSGDMVVAVDHFCGSPEHQKGGPSAVAEIVETGSTLPQFLANLQKHNLRALVEVAIGGSREIGLTWQGPIRLLFIDGDHSYEASCQDVEIWSKHIVPGGIMIFHDIDVFPGVTELYQQILVTGSAWKEIGRVRSLGIVQKK